jgi:GntR family transcriptional regulator
MIGPVSFSESAIPRYLQIADLLRRRIARGVWKNGEKVPSLEALMAEFGVARVTVRQAVDVIAREGLVSPQRGKGTFVTGTPPRRQWQREWQTVHASVDALAQAFQDTQPRIVTIDESISDAPLRPDDGVSAGRYVYMRRVHSEKDEPYCVIEIYIDEAIFRRAPERYRSEAVIPLLADLSDHGISQARQVLTIGNADMDVARLLNMHAGDSVVEVRRVFTDRDGRVIYLGEVTYRGDSFRLEMDLEPPRRRPPDGSGLPEDVSPTGIKGI